MSSYIFIKVFTTPHKGCIGARELIRKFCKIFSSKRRCLETKVLSELKLNFSIKIYPLNT